mmetsp:Transcript_64604/g.189394  ORF Transcript_64604/g.189394 Transcript_64604/m.189394 type:complete len:836 (+) Transcript_64604:42-2549(+)
MLRTGGARPGGADPGETLGTPTAHGAEGRMYLVRAPIMPMLSLSEEEGPIIFRPFKMRGQVLSGLQGKTLGTRKRFAAGDVAPPRVFKEDSPVPVTAEDPRDAAVHRLVLWAPPADEAEGRREVVVDPVLSRVLREHQRIGVQFLFDCLMGIKDFEGCGCILADDMGLGKTLQSVSIVWTLLTQGGPGGRAACRKALVVCPASLVKNWAGEFDKWLGAGTLRYTAVAVSGQAQVSGTFLSFRHSYESKVLICSYETFRGHASEVADCGIDLVVCDEAHKLKNEDASTTKCIAALSAKRRLLISGTPIQNNLDEFFTLASVANPGVFGDLSNFKRNYGGPILRGREPTATPDERRLAQEKLVEVSEMTERFILRRTNRLNARFLPAKQVFNVFVDLSDFQRRLYQSFLRSAVAQKVLDQNTKMTRTVLGTIKKLQSLVNHPFLVRSATQKIESGFDDDETRAMFQEVDALDTGLRSAQRPVREELSGKLLLLQRMLAGISASGSGDRVVIISNWTSTLDVIEKMCEQYKWPLHRLDGTMAIGKRMKLVQDFNRPDNAKAFAFLLSSKAGGCGLNLVGANRLVMFDPDWNPANDRQAMARIWRDGQKKKCYIYRLFTTGTIDEKVYQRQICKDGLSTMMMTETGDDEPSEMKESLAAELVKDLFSLEEATLCGTHDMLGCKRCGDSALRRCPRGRPPATSVPQKGEVEEDNLDTWSHHAGTAGVEDNILVEAATRGPRVTFTMGCHIEFTAAQIARLEEEERAEQSRREAEALSSATRSSTEIEAKAAAGSASASAAEVEEPPGGAPGGGPSRKWRRLRATDRQQEALEAGPVAGGA